ncbi:UNC93-like protein MFSD11 isoform X2 [Syngnathoides biaculeatus]|uniref:UNC93-like protein MFSD11 isoform X2 n=1 Tax=Syngnathoides biaculeatus TaxID=300417 RepID=UPI002ADD90D7|nr:UNC93-like protein MFSD11 isoform X2 [Syngnathoides biaculeatus]
MGPEGKKLMNIVVLGVAFMLIFTAFQTCGNIEQTVLKSFNSTSFHASGYTSMAIIYGVFSASNLLAPSVVAVAGPQLSMFFSGLLYSAYIAVFVYPYTWSFYAASALVGAGAAVLWTAQGNVLAINSDRSTIGRNSGVFWALLQCSLLFGNAYIFLAWRGHERISDKDRQTVFISLTVIGLAGCFLFFLIRTPDAEVPAHADRPDSPLLPSDSGDGPSCLRILCLKESCSTHLFSRQAASLAHLLASRGRFRRAHPPTGSRDAADAKARERPPPSEYGGPGRKGTPEPPAINDVTRIRPRSAGVQDVCDQGDGAAQPVHRLHRRGADVLQRRVRDVRRRHRRLGAGRQEPDRPVGHLRGPGRDRGRGRFRRAQQARRRAGGPQSRGAAGPAGALPGLLPHLRQHPRRRPAGARGGNAAQRLHPPQRGRGLAVQLPAGLGRQLLQHAAAQHHRRHLP